jgi:hypothetical protein
MTRLALSGGEDIATSISAIARSVHTHAPICFPLRYLRRMLWRGGFRGRIDVN